MMKRFTQLFVFGLLATGLVFTSCKKDEPDNPGSNNTNNNTNNNNTNTHQESFTAEINDGTPKTFELASYTATYSNLDNSVNISANDKDQVTTIGMVLPINAEGTITAMEANITVFKNIGGGTPPFYQATSGQVNITKIDKTNRIVEGNFECQLTDTQNGGKTASISNASFSIKYTE